VKLVVMAIRDENSGNLDNAQKAMASAMLLMDKREQASTLSVGMPVIVDTQRQAALQPPYMRGVML